MIIGSGSGAVTRTYCYDAADRLRATSEPGVGSITYDSHGDMTGIRGEFAVRCGFTAGSDSPSVVRDGTKKGHLDCPGWISFSFTKKNGRMKRIYRTFAVRVWTGFADNLRRQKW